MTKKQENKKKNYDSSRKKQLAVDRDRTSSSAATDFLKPAPASSTTMLTPLLLAYACTAVTAASKLLRTC
jgi:hypothetical protein